MSDADLARAIRVLSGGSTAATDTPQGLPPVAPRGALPSQRGTAAAPASGQTRPTGGAGGVSSPLTEASYAARTYHSPTTIMSSDGIFALQIAAVASVTLRDADDRQIVLQLAAPGT
ncbi:MAG: hypothetical protein JNM98_05995 [Rhodocyclaceae bacterium]|nr:hypothetical protein [Rhodocyclaceae bacterium]